MQLKSFNSEHIKEETFVRIYQQILKGNIQDTQLINLVYKYFHGNPDQLFKLYYQREEPTKNPYKNKNCYSCGIKGHIKRDCTIQGLAEEEIEFVFQKPIHCSYCKGEHLIEDCRRLQKKKVFVPVFEPVFEEIPDDLPYEEDPYED
jgi:hypothetical protein